MNNEKSVERKTGLARIVVKKQILRAQHWWLQRDIEVGEVWYKCSDVYGVLGKDGTGVLATQNQETGYPFFELPKSHVEIDKDEPRV